MTPSPNLITSTTVAPNPSIFDQLQQWYTLNIVLPLITTYGLAAFLTTSQQALNETDPDTGLTFIRSFTLTIGTGFSFPLYYQTYVLLNGNAQAILAIILATYANLNSVPVPQPLAPAPAAPVPPPPPSNPVGSLISPDPFSSIGRYNNLAGNAAPSLSPYTAGDGTVYVLQIGGGIFGKSYWWVRQSDLAATAPKAS